MLQGGVSPFDGLLVTLLLIAASFVANSQYIGGLCSAGDDQETQGIMCTGSCDLNTCNGNKCYNYTARVKTPCFRHFREIVVTVFVFFCYNRDFNIVTLLQF